MEPGAYCRAVESYLCRKNDGHLIRIVGPAFELVCGWAEGGIPVAVVERAVDRTYARYYASGAARRRPVRIEWCEADVLDLFDEWKRAVGVTRADPGADPDSAPADPGGRRRRRSLAAHLDECLARLAGWTPPAGGPDPAAVIRQVAAAVTELERTRADGGTPRGETRRRLIERLAELDRALLDAARADVDAVDRRRLRDEAGQALEPFRARMPADAFAAALEKATGRLLVERLRLPRLAFD